MSRGKAPCTLGARQLVGRRLQQMPTITGVPMTNTTKSPMSNPLIAHRTAHVTRLGRKQRNSAARHGCSRDRWLAQAEYRCHNRLVTQSLPVICGITFTAWSQAERARCLAARFGSTTRAIDESKNANPKIFATRNDPCSNVHKPRSPSCMHRACRSWNLQDATKCWAHGT